ncbi:MAG TPA: hypothetical protein V6D28_22600 [Leptolyngbyaceae cyanobacterium]
MKLNSTVALTLILLVLMLGAGFVSGMWGFALGYEALKGVNQPDTRPTARGKNNQDTAPGTQKLVFLKEADILKSVRVRIQQANQQKQTKAQNTDEDSNNSAKSVAETQNSPSSVVNAAFPIISQDRAVTLAIRSVRQQPGSLLLDVSLKNEGSQTIKFLYSFLDVTDNQGRPLSASAEGLPGELPPNGQTFSGTVSIPATVLDGTDKVSLTLTDYPDQQLKLQTAGIPVR